MGSAYGRLSGSESGLDRTSVSNRKAARSPSGLRVVLGQSRRIPMGKSDFELSMDELRVIVDTQWRAHKECFP